MEIHLIYYDREVLVQCISHREFLESIRMLDRNVHVVWLYHIEDISLGVFCHELTANCRIENISFVS